MSSGSAYLPVNSNWLQYIDSAETVFEDLKLESRQLLSLKADEACRMMADESYKKDLWMWDQDWSVQTLKLKKQTTKKKKEERKEEEIKIPVIEDLSTSKETASDENKVSFGDLVMAANEKHKVLNEAYLNDLDNSITSTTKEIEELHKAFSHLFAFGDQLPVKRPYLAGYPAWYRKLCTKPGKEEDWTPGANNITTSMQVGQCLFFKPIVC